MCEVRQIGLVALGNFRRWRRNPRIFLVFCLGFVVCFLLSDKVLTFAGEHDTILQIMEPFIWTFGDANSILVLSLFPVIRSPGIEYVLVEVLSDCSSRCLKEVGIS